MRVLGISGTPRDGGNSELLLEEALQPFRADGWEVKLLQLRNMNVQPCRGCETCRSRGGGCVQHDDMQLVEEAFRWCDALLLAAPVYYRNINAKLMAMLERHYGLLEQQVLSGKAGAAIAVGRGTGQATTLSALYTWLLSCGVICVPGELNGLTANAAAAGDILQQPDKLRQARVLGANLLRIAERIK